MRCTGKRAQKRPPTTCRIAPISSWASHLVGRCSAFGVQQELEMRAHGGPFAFDDAVDDGVTPAAVGQQLMVAQHAILLGAETLDGAARRVVEPVGAELDGYAA